MNPRADSPIKVAGARRRINAERYFSLLATAVNRDPNKELREMVKASIPVQILRSNISMTAKLSWLELSLMASKRRPDVIIDFKKLAALLGKSVSTIRRAVRELVGAGLVMFKSWVCKTLKVFTLIWQKEPKENQFSTAASQDNPEEIVDPNPVVAAPAQESPPTKKSPFVHNENGVLCFQANEEHQVRDIAYKLLDIGFSKEGAIEMMGKRGLAGCKELIDELALLEQQGQIISDKAAWVRNWGRD